MTYDFAPHYIVFKGAPGVLASPFAMPGFGTLTAYGATAPGGTIKPQLIIISPNIYYYTTTTVQAVLDSRNVMH